MSSLISLWYPTIKDFIFSKSFVSDISANLDSLNAKLVADDSSGTITTRTYTNVTQAQYDDFNTLVGELNNPASDTSYKNYDLLTYFTPYEVIILSVNETGVSITVNHEAPFLVGTLVVYKTIYMEVLYKPQHFGDQSLMKQVRQGTFMFDQTNFYGGTISYASDLSQNFESVQFELDGIGDWGAQPWGGVVWGGEGKEVPKRTYIPRQKQRCRFLKVKLEHRIAREIVKLNGISLDPRSVSKRAYK